LILETQFETADGAVVLIDFMPSRGQASDVVRLVRGLHGKAKMRMELVIRFGFGNDIPGVRRDEDGTALLAIGGPDMTVLRTPVALTHIALINTAHNLDQLRKESQKPAMQRSQ
jgi:hypothetical protein